MKEVLKILVTDPIGLAWVVFLLGLISIVIVMAVN